ncbi:pentapeptide repeat-containing protein [Actinomadura sp. ATCC 31491]|uniref:Pentapeptide repeat-containing protein n=1 Tax=Actinomadura luzonensis TaxID=2805427 RepID=A0ABT0G2X3_9ACTN|nr:pentapeptide repeat-containing protein [Actinomadura luzonensis]MCK2218944.1 pentapeptide repeat-containing protein [Actinomadura luzonensis]
MDWVTCAYSAACTGIANRPSGLCLAHLSPEQLAEALACLAPGRLLDLRGTTITSDLLARVLEAAGGRPGRTRLDRARFTGDVRLSGVTFTGDVSLDEARFDRLASFFGARFDGNVSLAGARFTRELSFHGVAVRGHVSLDRAVMSRDALFSQAVFGRGLSCERARFDGYATFDGARLGDGAAFRGARFGRTLSFRKVSGTAGFEAAHFAADAYLSATARLSLARARADGLLDVSVARCGLDLRGVEVTGATAVKLTDSSADLEGAVLRGPAVVSGRGRSGLSSLRQVDAADLALHGLDLSACRFAGLTHPSGVRVKDCTFALTPRGVRVSLRWPVLRWFSRRSALADEYDRYAGPGGDGGPAPGRAGVTPDNLAVLYAGLRPSDRATSADFAFAAMEMRRRAGHHWWLPVSWLLFGYGLRLGRTVGWFATLAAIAAVAVLWTSTGHAAVVHR